MNEGKPDVRVSSLVWNLFRSRRRQRLAEVARRLRGELYNYWGDPRVRVRVGPMTIQLSYGVYNMALAGVVLRGGVENEAGLRFTLTRWGFFGRAARRFITVRKSGDERFDRAFRMTSKSGEVEQLFSDTVVQERCHALSDVYATTMDSEGLVGPRYADGVDLLHIELSDRDRTVDALVNAFLLFARLRDRLAGPGASSYQMLFDRTMGRDTDETTVADLLVDRLRAATTFFGGQAARVGDGVVVRPQLPELEGLDVDPGELEVGVPTLPTLTAGIVAKLGLPPRPLGESEETGQTDLEERLRALVGRRPVVTIFEGALDARLQCHDDEVERAVELLLEAWRKLARQRLGLETTSS